MRNTKRIILLNNYIKKIGITTADELERFYNEESYKGETLEHCLKRYCAFLKRWQVNVNNNIK